MIEKLLPASMKNSENPFYEVLLEETDNMIVEYTEEKLKRIKDIYSISTASLDDLLHIASGIYLLDEKIIKMGYDFLTTQYDANTALEIFRDEIAKISVSMANRGTAAFYRSILNTFGYEYPGVLCPMKIYEESRVGRLIDAIDLTKHPVHDSGTAFVPVPVNEDFNIIDLLTQTLDDNKGTEESPLYDTLDMGGEFNKLDQASLLEETMYKKDVLLGFVLNQNYFSNTDACPYEFTRFMQEIIALNQKATDVIHLTGIVSIDIDKRDLDNVAYVPEENSFIIVDNGVTFADIAPLGFNIEMVAYEYDPIEDAPVEFYNSYLQPVIEYNYNAVYDDDEVVLTMKSTVEGCRYKLSRLNCIDATVLYPNTVYVLEAYLTSGYAHYLTNNLVIKLFDKTSENDGFFLFKQNKNGLFEQCFGPMSGDGSFTYDVKVTVDKENAVIRFESVSAFFDDQKEYQITFTSEKNETKLHQVSFYAWYVRDNEIVKTEITNIIFNSHRYALANLPPNVDMMFLISRHEGVTV